MKKANKTAFWKILHNLAIALHLAKANGEKVDVNDLRTVGETALTVAKIYTAISDETKNIADPAERAKAICKAVLEHEKDLPVDLQGFLEANVNSYIQTLTGLPWEEAEAIIKVELKK